MSKIKRAERYYVQQEVKGMIDHNISTEDMERAFISGFELGKQKAIETFKFTTSGYFIIGGTDYSGNRIKEFIEKLNS